MNEDGLEKFRSHCEVSDTVQLYMRGIWNSPQLEHLIKEGLPHVTVDEAHKCEIRNCQLPCLEFGTGKPMANRNDDVVEEMSNLVTVCRNPSF
jgi:hypothetical protein